MKNKVTLKNRVKAMDHDIGTGELAQIRALMSESHELLTGTWRHQLIWGLLTALGLSGTWVLVAAEETHPRLARSK